MRLRYQKSQNVKLTVLSKTSFNCNGGKTDFDVIVLDFLVIVTAVYGIKTTEN